MNLADFRKDKNGIPYKCKYHCDFGDGEFCYYREGGCALNLTKSQCEEIKGRIMSDAESMGMHFDDPPDIPDKVIPVVKRKNLIVITTMKELPNYCYECPCHNGEHGMCEADTEKRSTLEYRPYWCPLTKV